MAVALPGLAPGEELLAVAIWSLLPPGACHRSGGAWPCTTGNADERVEGPTAMLMATGRPKPAWSRGPDGNADGNLALLHAETLKKP
jgi:hypothetical protein